MQKYGNGDRGASSASTPVTAEKPVGFWVVEYWFVSRWIEFWRGIDRERARQEFTTLCDSWGLATIRIRDPHGAAFTRRINPLAVESDEPQQSLPLVGAK